MKTKTQNQINGILFKTGFFSMLVFFQLLSFTIKGQVNTSKPLPLEISIKEELKESPSGNQLFFEGETQKDSVKLPALKSTSANPNLSPYQPTDWDSKIVISTVTGTSSSASTIYDNQQIFIDWAVINNSTTNITATFVTNLFIDDIWYGTYNTYGLNSNYYTYMKDIQIAKLSAGTHIIKIVTDANNNVLESDESDNQYSRSKSTTTNICVNVAPYKPSGWDDQIVLSTVTGTNKNSATIPENQTIYLDVAIQNNGSCDINQVFYTKIYVDNALKSTYNTNRLQSGYYTSIIDEPIGPLTAGSHTIKVVLDANNNINESDENDNIISITKTISVSACANLLPYKPTGWDDKIVVSTEPGTKTNASVIYDNQNLYIDWALINNGTCNITETIYSSLYVDGILFSNYNTFGLNSWNYSAAEDILLSPLSAGSHSIKITVDSNNNVKESDENDNSYTRTFTVTKKQSIPDIKVSATSLTINEPAGASKSPSYTFIDNSYNNQIKSAQNDNFSGAHSYGCLIPDSVISYFHNKEKSAEIISGLASAIDWSNNDSPVKNQQTCGSCSYFAAVACIENLGNQSDLSEQAIISCSNTRGCAGENYDVILKYILNNGVPPESCYPYSSSNGNCSIKCQQPALLEKITSYSNYLWGIASVNNLKSYLQTNPLIVTMQIPDDLSFDNYKGGIYNFSGISAKSNYHAVLLVGYDDSQNCFKVKNSWGPSWGESGYFRIDYSDVSDLQFGSYAIQVSGAYTQNTNENSFSIMNQGMGDLSVTSVTDNADWLTLSGLPGISFSIAPSGNQIVALNVNWALVGSSTKTGVITIKSNDPNSPSLTVQVSAVPKSKTLSVSPLSQTASSSAGSKNFTITSNSNWTATSDQNWCTVTTSGSGNGTLTASFSTNTTAVSRIANIMVTASGLNPVVVTLNQTAGSGSLTVSPSSQTASSDAGSKNFTVTSNNSWNAASDQNWCTVTSSGNGNGALTASFSTNTTAVTRIANITVTSPGLNSVVITLNQSAGSGILTVSPSSQTASSDAGSKNFTVTSNGNWIATSNQNWCSVTSSGNGNGTLIAAYSQNSDIKERIAEITLSSNGSSQVVTLNQSGISNSGTSLSFGSQHNSGSNIVIPVVAKDFSDVTGFQFTIAYDASKLAYYSCSNWQGGTNSGGVQITNLASNGKITFVYNDVPVNISNGKFFELVFTQKATSGSTEISWSDSPTIREISNSSGKEIACNYNNGNISFITGYTITGNLSYPNYSNSTFTPLNGISIELSNQNNLVSTASTENKGNYQFTGVQNGNYTLNPSIELPWNYVTAMDITAFKKHIGSVETLTSLQVKSGDVNGSGTLTSADLTIIKQRIGAQISSFTVGDWVWDPISVVVDGNNIDLNINAICYGDANGSYVPNSGIAGSTYGMFSAGNESLTMLNEREFKVQFKVNKTIKNLSSVTLFFSYPSDLLDIKFLQMNTRNEDLYYTVKDGIIRVVFSTLTPLNLQNNDELFNLILTLKPGISMIALTDSNYLFTGQGEFGDYSNNIVNDVVLSYSRLIYTPINDFLIEEDVKVYPNPAENYLKIENAQDAYVKIFDINGRKLMSTFCNSSFFELNIQKLLPGAYSLTIDKNDKTIFRGIVIKK